MEEAHRQAAPMRPPRRGRRARRAARSRTVLVVLGVFAILLPTACADRSGAPPAADADTGTSADTTDATDTPAGDASTGGAGDDLPGDQPDDQPDDQPGGQPVVGEVVELADGTVARLNGVDRDVTLEPGLPQPEPGMRIDRIDVEVCAGTGARFVDAAFWLGHGDDAQVHSAHLGVRDFRGLVLAPGVCQRGTVDLALPDDVELVGVLLSDEDRSSAARWATGGDAPPDPPPLRSDTAPDVADLGVAVDLPAGGTATLRGVDPQDAGTAAADGAAVVRIDGERCAGDHPVPTSPRFWYLQLEDNRLVAAQRDGGDATPTDVAPGACEAGTVEFTAPGSSRVEAVVYAEDGLYAAARWTLAAG